MWSETGSVVEVGERVDALRGEAEVLGGFGGVLGDVGGDHLRVHRPGGGVPLGGGRGRAGRRAGAPNRSSQVGPPAS